MSDLIDRQALLEKKIRIPIARIVTEDKILYRDVVFVKDIEALPPAQPEIIRCKDCKYYEGVHNIQGHAPCTYWKSGGVLWNWFCSQAERREDG